MSKIVFSSDDLGPELDDDARFAAWHDIYVTNSCQVDVKRLDHVPFSIRTEIMPAGGLALLRSKGTTYRYSRTARQVANDPYAAFYLAINGPRPWMMEQRGHSCDLPARSMTLLSTVEPSCREHSGGVEGQGVVIPTGRLDQLVRHPDDLIGRPFDPRSEVARHLRRYIELLLVSDEFDRVPALLSLVETTLVDLVALLLNGRRDVVELAGLRGLAAARLRAILAEIDRGFSRGDFSPQQIAPKLGLSVNYIQKLLHESGATFTERVIEMRMLKARAMLTDMRSAHLKVSDIALACGFNEVSYFNRCFRRRFGLAPNELRGDDKVH